MEPAVKVGRREATLVMSTRRQVRLSGIGALIGSTLGEAYGYLGAQRAETDGPPFVIYYGVPVADDPFEVEVCAPIAGPMDAPTGWRVQQLPAGTFATLLHVGPYDTVGVAYDTLTGWLRTHDLVVMGPPREVYLSDGNTPPEQIRTIIEFPVAEAAASVAAG